MAERLGVMGLADLGRLQRQNMIKQQEAQNLSLQQSRLQLDNLSSVQGQRIESPDARLAQINRSQEFFAGLAPVSGGASFLAGALAARGEQEAKKVDAASLINQRVADQQQQFQNQISQATAETNAIRSALDISESVRKDKKLTSSIGLTEAQTLSTEATAKSIDLQNQITESTKQETIDAETAKLDAEKYQANVTQDITTAVDEQGNLIAVEAGVSALEAQTAQNQFNEFLNDLNMSDANKSALELEVKTKEKIAKNVNQNIDSILEKQKAASERSAKAVENLASQKRQSVYNQSDAARRIASANIALSTISDETVADLDSSEREIFNIINTGSTDISSFNKKFTKINKEISGGLDIINQQFNEKGVNVQDGVIDSSTGEMNSTLYNLSRTYRNIQDLHRVYGEAIQNIGFLSYDSPATGDFSGDVSGVIQAGEDFQSIGEKVKGMEGKLDNVVKTIASKSDNVTEEMVWDYIKTRDSNQLSSINAGMFNLEPVSQSAE